MSHEVETMFSARELPWHGLGVVTDDALTAEDAITAAGLDWEVVKHQLYRAETELTGEGVTTKHIEVPNRYGLYRDSDMHLMTIVSDDYNPFQNREAFTFMNSLVNDGDARYETAGSLRHGAVVFLTMEIPSHIVVAGGDQIKMYLLLRTSHDGSGRISCYVVMVRVVCMNTLTMAINGAKHCWGITHAANDVAGKVGEARHSLGLSFEYAEAFKKRADRLAQVTVTDDLLVKLLESEIRETPRRDDVIEAIMENYRTSETVAGYEGTAWGFLNGLTEWNEHLSGGRSDQAAFMKLIGGPHEKLRTNVSAKLLRV